MIENRYTLYWTGDYFTIHNYLSLKSILETECPESITLYYNNPPKDNEWWERSKTIVDMKEFIPSDYPEMEFLPLNTDHLSKSKSLRTVSDLIRLVLMYHHGGIYADLDTLYVSNMFEKHLRGHAGFFANTRTVNFVYGDKSHKGCLSYGHFGCAPKHPCFAAILERIKKLLSGSDQPSYSQIFHEAMTSFLENQDSYENFTVLDWKVCHYIDHKVCYPSASTVSIDDFFLCPREVPKETCVLHYFSSKKEAARHLKRLDHPCDIYRSRGCYASHAVKFLDDELINSEWETHYRTPDRVIFENEIIPKLKGDVLYIGTSKNNKHYWDKFEGATLTTFDPEEMQAEYGCSNHVIGRVQKVHKYFTKQFNAIIFDEVTMRIVWKPWDIDKCLIGCCEILKDDGVLIFGYSRSGRWRLDRLSNGDILSRKNVNNLYQSYHYEPFGDWLITRDFLEQYRPYNVPDEEIFSRDYTFRFLAKKVV